MLRTRDFVKKLPVQCRMPWSFVVAWAFFVGAVVSLAQTKQAAVIPMRLDSLNGLEIVDGKAEIVTYGGRRALHLSPPPDLQTNDASVLAIVTAADFTNGTIEVEVAGKPRAGAPATREASSVFCSECKTTSAGRKLLSSSHQWPRR